MAGEVKVTGLTATVGNLEKIEKRGRDYSDVFRFKIDPEISRLFEKRFQSAGGFGSTGGERWKPLAPSTIANRLRRSTSSGKSSFVGKRGGNRGGVGRPLWDFGLLRSSLVKYLAGGLSIRNITPKQLERGTLVSYAAIHQEGRGRVPAREIVPDPLDPYIADRWARMILGHTVGESL